MAKDKKNSDASKELIEQNLRRVYDETIREEIPDRFKALLDRLRSSETGKGANR
jgi:hemerythrin-like domain-containing protein